MENSLWLTTLKLHFTTAFSRSSCVSQSGGYSSVGMTRHHSAPAGIAPKSESNHKAKMREAHVALGKQEIWL